MRRHRLTQAVLLASTALAAPAWAQNAPAPVHMWDGPYIGIYGGALGLFTDGYESFLDTSIDYDAWGAAGGGTLGFNKQFGMYVFGVEGDIGAAALGDLEGDAPAGLNTGGSADIDVLATLRARAGLAMDGTLIYLTGGLAFADLDETVRFDYIGDLAYRESGWRAGLAAGAGIEHAFNEHWSAKAEALYLDFGDDRDGSGPYTFRFDNSAVLARAGINFGF